MQPTNLFLQLLSSVLGRGKLKEKERSICGVVGHTWLYVYEEALEPWAGLCANCRRLGIFGDSGVIQLTGPIVLPSPSPVSAYTACCEGLVREFYKEFAVGHFRPTMIEKEV